VRATGYAFDFSSVKLPVVDSDGYPIQKRGVTRYPGLYFLGLPWLYNRRSGILFGVGDDAAYLAAHIAAPDSQSILNKNKVNNCSTTRREQQTAGK
jgi:putative flavoprotein involved in K+ transport